MQFQENSLTTGSGLSSTARCISWRKFLGLTLVLCVCSLAVLMGHEVVAQVSKLYSLSSGPHPYFVPNLSWLLYFTTPFVVVCSFIFFLAPGGLLVLAFRQVRNAAEWMVLSFGASLVLFIILSTGAKLTLGLPFSRPILLTLWLITIFMAWLILFYRINTGVALIWPITLRTDIRKLLWMFGMSMLGVAVLVPKIFWENFNIDGVEAFEFGRSLTTHIFPYWEIKDGVFGFYQNFSLFAYPNNWFFTIFGPFEASARLPYFLYLLVLFSGLILLIESGKKRKLSVFEEAALWLGLIIYTVVQAYNATYEPFFADLAETGATDTLFVLCFLSASYFIFAGRKLWFWLFALMTYLASPGGIILLGALFVIAFLCDLPDKRKQITTIGTVIMVCLFIGLAHDTLYNAIALGGAKNQFSVMNGIRRFYPPTLSRFTRLNVLVFTSGILPAFSLLLVRRRDVINIMIAGVSIVYFCIVYIQAWTSLHQYTPIMILPLIVFWRHYLDRSLKEQRWLLPSIAATTILCIYLSLPQHFQINQATREFALATDYRIGDYEQSYEHAVRKSRSLYTLLPEDYRLQYPDQSWGTDPLIWIYYANREKPPDTKINYVVQAANDKPPFGATLVMAQNGVSTYVLDVDIWRRDKEPELPRIVMS